MREGRKIPITLLDTSRSEGGEERGRKPKGGRRKDAFSRSDNDDGGTQRRTVLQVTTTPR